ncbi:MAG TPA: ABC transporter ATP-binding protein [Chloroflexota bacterium]|nr:ABC transporter ATP-binding protein [Chloroflexota bacterium]
MNDYALELQGLSKRFGGLLAVDGVTAEVPVGRRLAIIGPNGAGKTTLFHLISGELPLTHGSIRLLGQDVTRTPAQRRVALGLRRTYQITNLFPALSIEQNVLLAVYGLRADRWHPLRLVPRRGQLLERVRQALEQVGLTRAAGVSARALSHGEQRQLELALALVWQPKVLLLDEPAAGLSTAERGLIGHIIRGLPPELTLVLIEHDMDLALSLAEYVLCLHNGRVIAAGDPGEIRRNQVVQDVYLGSPAA